MRRLFEMDRRDHDGCSRNFVRNSARAVVIRDGKLAMVHSVKYDYYKFPGGGIEKGERPVDALIRETAEEAGLNIVPETVVEYGCVHRIQRSETDASERFIQDNYYFLCAVEESRTAQRLDDYESDERFTPEFIDPAVAIRANRFSDHGPKDPVMIEREARVLELLIAEGYFD